MKKNIISVAITALFLVSAFAFVIPQTDDLKADGPLNNENWIDTDFDTDWYYNHAGDGPYIITTASELAGLAYLVNNDIEDFKDMCIRVVPADGVEIDLSEYYWTPIGSEYMHFKGTFDGNNVVIKGLYIGTEENRKDWVALFSYVGKTGEILNVSIRDSVIYGKDTVASIVAYNEGLVENCNSNADSFGKLTVAGVVGYNHGGTVRYCYNLGTISGVGNVAGVVGTSDSTDDTTSLVERSFNAGDLVQALNKNSYYYSFLASGVVGIQRAGLVTDCYNIGTFIVQDATSTTISGIASRAILDGAEITRCYNAGGILSFGLIPAEDLNYSPISNPSVGLGENYWLDSPNRPNLKINEMTGNNALTHMPALFPEGGDVWYIEQSASYDDTQKTAYMPQLRFFAENGVSSIVKDSMNSTKVLLEKADLPDGFTIGQNGIYEYFVGQKLSDISPNEIVPEGFNGYFEWVNPEYILNDKGETVMEMKFVSVDHKTYTFNVNIIVDDDLPPGTVIEDGDDTLADGVADNEGGTLVYFVVILTALVSIALLMSRRE